MAAKESEGPMISDGTIIIAFLLFCGLVLTSLLVTPLSPKTPPGGNNCVPITEVKTLGGGIRTDITDRNDPDLGNIRAALSTGQELVRLKGQLCLKK